MAADPSLLPAWVEAAATAAGSVASFGALGLAIHDRRRRRGLEFAEAAIAIAELAPGDAVEVIVGDERLTELFEIGLDEAIRSAAAEKRWLLSRVLASALSASDDARLEEYAIVMRAVAAVEPYHVRLLVEIATPDIDPVHAGGRLEGAKSIDFISKRFQRDQRDLVGAMLSVLERESLVENRPLETYGGMSIGSAYAVTRFGTRFMRFLPGGPIDVPRARSATVVARYESTPGARASESTHAVVITNLGLDDATITNISIVSPSSKRSPLHGDDVNEPVPLRPWDRLSLATKAPSDDWPLPYEVHIRFTDGEGVHELITPVGAQGRS